jgi:predicted glycoside hydrolase/deacetylase ChbG (UPF0249 family)
LIVNADDYGLTRGVSRGIRAAHLLGIVTSTTVMMNMPGAGDDLRLALDETPALGLGVHLVLTAGQPALEPGQVADLVASDGRFHSLEALSAEREHIALEQVRAEWTAQIQAFIVATGKTPDHLDSHHHTSFFSAGLFRTLLELAREYGCAIRCPLPTLDGSGLPAEVAEEFAAFAPTLLEEFGTRRPGLFCASFYDTGATGANLLSILERLPSGTAELMCHPAYDDDELTAVSSYVAPRAAELALLSGPAIRAAIASRRIQLINFADLVSENPA